MIVSPYEGGIFQVLLGDDLKNPTINAHRGLKWPIQSGGVGTRSMIFGGMSPRPHPR